MLALEKKRKNRNSRKAIIREFLLTFHVVLQYRSVVIPSALHGQRRCRVALAALVPGDHFDLAVVPVLTLRDVQVPHTVVDQLVTASLNNFYL